MSERDPHDIDRQIEDLEHQGEKVQDDIDETRQDWEKKQEDPSVPGAVSEGDDPLSEG